MKKIHIHQATKQLLSQLGKDWETYITEALKLYNSYHRKKFLSDQLKNESQLVTEDSIHILQEFEQLQA